MAKDDAASEDEIDEGRFAEFAAPRAVWFMHRFQSFWFGSELPVYQRLALKSFIDFGFRYTLYSYQKFDVPHGVELRDAGEIHEVGGWWVDADVVCLSEKVPETDVFMGWESEDLIGSAILKVPKHHWLARDLRDAADGAGTNIAWGETGPYLITRLVAEHGLFDLISTQATSFPVQSKDALHLLMPQRRGQVREQVKCSPFLHIWNEILRRAVVFTWMAPPPDSFIAELFDRHGISFGDAPVYTADQIQRLNDNYCNTYVRWESEQTISLRSQLSDARLQIDRFAHELQRSRAEICELKSSKSWRMTALARHVSTLLRGCFR